MADLEKVISHLQIIHTWASFALENDLSFFTMAHMERLAEWTTDTLKLLKEQGVKHGEWISIWREDDPDTSTDARCSVCNRVSKRPAGEYCKWCGAKMDLEGR